MQRLFLSLAGIATAAVLCWFFPLFHVVSLEKARQEKAATVFDSIKFAETFWASRLREAINQSVKADVLIAAIQADPAEARRKFSRSVGVSESYSYFLSGKGRVLAVKDDEVLLAISEGATEAEVALQRGMIFGNALRDGTGLLTANDFPNSQDFNSVGEALNHLVETRVLPELRTKVRVGATVRFAGCAEVNDEAADLKPLKVIPIQAEMQ